MAGQEQDQDRTEPATPYKREEARRKGQVAKSLDTNSVFMLAAALASAAIWGRRFISDGADGFRQLLGHAQEFPFEPAGLSAWMDSLFRNVAHSLAPFFLLVILVGVLSNLLQTGPIFSFQPLKPDMQRLNPVQGFKRIYSTKALFEAGKSLLKLGLFAAVAWSAIVSLLPGIMGMLGTEPQGYPLMLLGLAQSLAFKLTLAMLIVALLDLAYVRWDFAKKMRMSRREQKEEVKRREGDPHIRAKRRELQREAAKRSASMRRVPDADVLITNPTHLAIALRYERGRALAPKCLAKGAGETALRMRTMAQRHGVIIVEQRSLARALFDEVAIDALIPESLYEPVARVYAEVAVIRRNASTVTGSTAPRSKVEVRA
jgi:flagellar biosynthetic protein FlhB